MIEAERLKELKDIMGDDFNDLIEMFMDDTKERFNKLQTLFSQTTLDHLAIKIEAHTLKGSCGNLFAVELHQLFYKLERMAFENRLHERGDLMQQIESEIKIVLEEIVGFK